jgi:carboxymethylenebutenolidase
MGEMISIRQQSGAIQAYKSVSPKTVEFKGGIIVAHELWGLTEQIKGVADRFAEQGYFVLAPDLYSTDKVNRRPSAELEAELFSASERVRYGAMPKLRAMIAPTQTPQFTLLALSKLESCFEYIYNQPLVHQRVGVVGFGLGGKYAFDMALREARLRAVVPFYGHAPHITAELRHIKPPIMAFYGFKEQTLIKELTDLIPRMEQAGVDFTPVIYKGSGHAFFNEANIYSYDKQAADDSWRRALSFLAAHLV